MQLLNQLIHFCLLFCCTCEITNVQKIAQTPLQLVLLPPRAQLPLLNCDWAATVAVGEEPKLGLIGILLLRGSIHFTAPALES